MEIKVNYFIVDNKNNWKHFQNNTFIKLYYNILINKYIENFDKGLINKALFGEYLFQNLIFQYKTGYLQHEKNHNIELREM